MGERWRLATEHRKPIAFLVTWITGLHDVWVQPSGIDCIDHLASLLFFRIIVLSSELKRIFKNGHFFRWASWKISSSFVQWYKWRLFIIGKSSQIVDSAQREIGRLLNDSSKCIESFIAIVTVFICIKSRSVSGWFLPYGKKESHRLPLWVWFCRVPRWMNVRWFNGQKNQFV